MKYNLKPDTRDDRDLKYRQRMFTLPEKVDLRKYCSPIENQGEIGSCTANALVGNLEFLEKKLKLPYTDLSRLFVYYNERMVENHVAEDAGATLRDGIKVLKKFGVCTESLWPYDEKHLLVKPDEDAYNQALGHRISLYERISSLEQMKDCLASGFPFVFGIQVFESFESADVAKTGVVPLPSRAERLLGGHALLAVGYDESEKVFIFRNSWGQSWGDRGCGIIPYAYLTGGLAQDFWTIQSYLAQRAKLLM